LEYKTNVDLRGLKISWLGKFHGEKLRTFYFSENVVWLTKSNWIRRTGCASRV